MGGKLSYYHDIYDLEADAVLHLQDGRYALIEIKLGYEYAVDAAAESLLKVAEKLENKPSFLAVVSGTAPIPLKRPDGVYVLPLTA